MSIRFPRMHLAESVVNRIFNTLAELEQEQQPAAQPPAGLNGLHIQQALEELSASGGPITFEALRVRAEELAAAPAVPDPTLEGAELDMELNQPTPELAPAADPITTTVARGANLIDSL